MFKDGKHELCSATRTQIVSRSLKQGSYKDHTKIILPVVKSRERDGEQGWRSGESARLPPMCPRFDSRTRRHMWVEFVVGSLLCSERFVSRILRFSPLLKNQHFQISILAWKVSPISAKALEDMTLKEK